MYSNTCCNELSSLKHNSTRWKQNTDKSKTDLNAIDEQKEMTIQSGDCHQTMISLKVWKLGPISAKYVKKEKGGLERSKIGMTLTRKTHKDEDEILSRTPRLRTEIKINALPVLA